VGATLPRAQATHARCPPSRSRSGTSRDHLGQQRLRCRRHRSADLGESEHRALLEPPRGGASRTLRSRNCAASPRISPAPVSPSKRKPCAPPHAATIGAGEHLRSAHAFRGGGHCASSPLHLALRSYQRGRDSCAAECVVYRRCHAVCRGYSQ
jgi:hypothetical protein